MQRYKVRCHDCDPEIIPHEAGKWVRWGDVERLRAELAESKKEIALLKTPNLVWDFDDPENSAVDSVADAVYRRSNRRAACGTSG